MIKVLVVDDSPFMRQYLRGVLEKDAEIEVVGTASDGVFALQKIPIYKPDVITVDIEMPQMNGIEFIKEIMAVNPLPIVVISSYTEKNAGITFEALKMGAIDFITKPRGFKQIEHNISLEGEIVSKIKSAYYGKVGKLRGQQVGTGKKKEKVVGKGLVRKPRTEIIGIGISTGGPPIVEQILTSLPENYGIPIVIVQHMPEGFTREFAQRLDKLSAIEVREGKHGDLLRPGRAIIAPGGRQMAVKKEDLAPVIHVRTGERVSGHIPSIDVLFNSLAEEFGENTLAVIMTGMGHDGVVGLEAIKEKGGVVWAQNEESCVVYGMPRVAVQRGVVDAQLSVEEIIQQLRLL